LFFQHDATWIKPSYPGEGHILVFNNGNDRPGGPYSSVDEFAPPVNSNGEYYLAPGSAYGPEHVTWRYTANPPGTFYSQVFGGALRLKDNNTLICDGVSGRFFEVTPENTIVWQYINPYPNPTNNDVFKIEYLPAEEPPQKLIPDLDCSGSLSWPEAKPGATVRGSFQVQNIGDAGSLLNWTVDCSSIPWGTWTFTPESGNRLTPEQGPVTVQVSVIVPTQENTQFQGSLRIQNQDNASDHDTIPVTLKTPTTLRGTTEPPLQFLMRLWHSVLTNFFWRMEQGRLHRV